MTVKRHKATTKRHRTTTKRYKGLQRDTYDYKEIQMITKTHKATVKTCKTTTCHLQFFCVSFCFGFYVGGQGAFRCMCHAPLFHKLSVFVHVLLSWTCVNMNSCNCLFFVIICSGVLVSCQEDMWLISAPPHITKHAVEEIQLSRRFVINWKSNFCFQHNLIPSHILPRKLFFPLDSSNSCG